MNRKCKTYIKKEERATAREIKHKNAILWKTKSTENRANKYKLNL